MSLTTSMEAAIPVWIAKYKKQPLEAVSKRLNEQSAVFPDLIGGRGDVLFGGGKEGEAADMFNQAAEAVALMSFLPGGVSVFGHWETIHPDSDTTIHPESEVKTMHSENEE